MYRVRDGQLQVFLAHPGGPFFGKRPVPGRLPFTVYDSECQLFDYKDWKKYPTSNLTFEVIAKLLR